MSVSDLDTRGLLDADGIVTSFAIPFDFELGDNTQVRVYLVDDTTRAETLQVEGALQDYTLTGDDIPNGQNYTTVEFNTAPADGQKVLIERVTPLDQTDDYDNSASVPNTTLEAALDKATRQIQEADEKIGRSLKLTKGSANTNPVLDEPSAGKLVGWDSTGTKIEPKDSALDSLTLPAGNGLIAKTGATSSSVRTITGTANEIDVADGDGVSANPTVGLADNPVVPGNEHITVPVGTTAQRPSSPANGDIRYNSTLGDFEFYKAGSWVQLGSSGGSGTGSKNYWENPDFDSTTGVTTYDDAGAYVDGDGGSPSAVSVATTSTGGEVLAGNNSLEISKAASDASGEGVTLLTAALDRIDQGSKLFGKMSIDFSAANYVGGDVALKAYDVTNAAIIPVSVDGLEDDTIPGMKGIVRFSLDTESTTTTIRLSLHIESDSATASAYDLYLDEVTVGPQQVVTVMPYQDWTYYVPTWGAGFGTVSNNSGYWRRVGDTLEVQASCTVGTAAASAATITLPSGLSIDSAKLSISNTSSNPGPIVGEWDQNEALDNTKGVLVTATGTSTSLIYFGASERLSSSSVTPATGANVTASSAVLAVKFRVPIAGWGSNAVIGANRRTFRASEINWTRVTGSAPTRLGEYRSYLRQASSQTLSETNGAPAIAPSGDGFVIYGGVWGSTDANNEPSQYDIYIGKNRGYLIQAYANSGKTGQIFHQPYVDGAFGFGIRTSYDPTTGVLNLKLVTTGTASSGILPGTTESGGTVQDAYVDVIIGDSPADILLEWATWQDGGAIAVGATTTAPTKGSSIVIDKLGYQVISNTLNASYQYAQSNNTSAAAGSGTYLFSLPAGYEFDTRFINPDSSFADASVVGQGFAGTNGTSAGTTCVARAYSTTQFFLDGDNGTTAITKVGSTYFQMADASGIRYGVTLNCPVVKV